MKYAQIRSGRKLHLVFEYGDRLSLPWRDFMRIIICNKCGKQINNLKDHAVYLNKNNHNTDYIHLKYDRGDFIIDLCSSCVEKIIQESKIE